MLTETFARVEEFVARHENAALGKFR